MRIPHLNPPYDPEVADALAVMQPKHWHFEPLRLFRTLTLNLPLQTAMWELARFMLAPRSPSGASFDLRTRELIIDRVCARCGCEYEWGLHVGVFAAKAGITEEQAHSLAHGAGADPCWDSNDRATLNFVDELHDQGSVTEPTWRVMQARFSDATLLELLALAGWYHAICYIANGAQVEPEPWAPPFPQVR
jgi:alkylhydroperoxidase family enzyme